MKQLRGAELKRFKRKLDRPEAEIVLVLENIQYARNVASMFRTADAAGIRQLYLTGITPAPPFGKELRKVSRSKEQSVPWTAGKTTGKVLQTLRNKGFTIVALEITDEGMSADQFAETRLPGLSKVALVVGNEAQGVSKKTLERSDESIYIPMFGKGASLNVTISAAIAIYTLLLK
ncbi:MAG: tRNA (guanosine(18)-2'-O)-methyltransferase [candidate division WS6 bacterium OLB20]|uniref:tRNA (Guanosine(18)-2'-O)-methyltransferase n=1 Tax=candidate division WS6 bacterium OLB20 TaxID=1617426 RepID=A0A136M034_9BACT|nr:MAG: tRNA (guanosine(18)-2'-O)-methyltransferase [candidate division WS6 bacterium OLB20]